MPRASVLVVGAIPVAIAILIAVPLLLMDRVPATTLLPDDMIELEHTQRKIGTIAGVIERERALESRVLSIDPEGRTRLVVADAQGSSEYGAHLEAEDLLRVRALIKETGFMSIAPSSFVPEEPPAEYDLHTLRVKLNGDERRVRWAGEDLEGHLVPPIIVMIQEELDTIAKGLEG